MDSRESNLAKIRATIESGGWEEVFNNLNTIANLCYETACANGWHSTPRALSEPLLLLITEVIEVYEDIRDNGLEIGLKFEPADQAKGETMDKPVGIDSELADIFIRLCDLVGEWNVDLGLAIKTKMIYNTTRSYRHGGKPA